MNVIDGISCFYEKGVAMVNCVGIISMSPIRFVPVPPWVYSRLVEWVAECVTTLIGVVAPS